MSQNIDLQRYNAFTSRSRTIAVVSARVGGANVSICINNHKGEKLGNSSVTRGNVGVKDSIGFEPDAFRVESHDRARADTVLSNSSRRTIHRLRLVR